MIYFKGFYQSERFFADIEDDVRKTFCFNMELINIRSREMMKVIDADEHAVSIHIRRGDYLLPNSGQMPDVSVSCPIIKMP